MDREPARRHNARLRSRPCPMKFLFDLFPVALSVAAYAATGNLYVATAVIIPDMAWAVAVLADASS